MTTMSENHTYQTYSIARAAYDRSPSYPTAAEVLRWATALVQISDDYQHLLDEAHDLFDDH